jgi:hypothetical protein
MPKAESYFEFGDTSGVREEDAGRMDFYTPANVTPWTPPAARD